MARDRLNNIKLWLEKKFNALNSQLENNKWVELQNSKVLEAIAAHAAERFFNKRRPRFSSRDYEYVAEYISFNNDHYGDIHVKLPVDERYVGPTNIYQGWITIESLYKFIKDKGVQNYCEIA